MLLLYYHRCRCNQPLINIAIHIAVYFNFFSVQLQRLGLEASTLTLLHHIPSDLVNQLQELKAKL